MVDNNNSNESQQSNLFANCIVGILIFGGLGYWLLDGLGLIVGIAFGVYIGIQTDKNQQKEEAKNKTALTDYGNKKIDTTYQDIVVDLISICVASDGEVENVETEMAASFIENDEYITDKSSALERLHKNISSYIEERSKSKVLFELKITSVLQRCSQIDDELFKDRIKIIISGMRDSMNSPDKTDIDSVIEKINTKLKLAISAKSKQQIAEEYILSSGDAAAIQSLKEMKKNPATYGQQFKKAANGNTVMKTALGVFTGMIAANLVTNAIYQAQLQEALSNFNAELEAMGGLDEFNFNEPELNYASYDNDSSFIEGSECEPDIIDDVDIDKDISGDDVDFI